MHWPIIHYHIQPLRIWVGCPQLLKEEHQVLNPNLARSSVDHPSRSVFERRNYSCQGIAAVSPIGSRLLLTTRLGIGLRQRRLALKSEFIKIEHYYCSRCLSSQHTHSLHTSQFDRILLVGAVHIGASALIADTAAFEEARESRICAELQPGTGTPKERQAPTGTSEAKRRGFTADRLTQLLAGLLERLVARGKKPACGRDQL